MEIRIGTRITTETKTTVDYNEHGIKQLWHRPVPKGSYFVQRIVRKFLGKYVYYSSGCGDDDDCPAHLSVTGSVLLYQCARTITSRPFFVLPEHASVEKE